MVGEKTMDNTVKVAIIGGVFSLIIAIIGVFTGAIPGLIFNQPPSITGLTPTPPGPQVDGTPITWTAIAKDPNFLDTIYYRFELNGPSTKNRFVVKQDWSKEKDWIWNSTDSDIGINYIRVSARDDKLNETCLPPISYSIADRMMTQNATEADGALAPGAEDAHTEEPSSEPGKAEENKTDEAAKAAPEFESWSAVPAAKGSSITSVEHAGAPHIYYIGEDNMVQEILWTGSNWAYSNTGEKANAEPAAKGSSITSVEHAGPHIYYIGEDNMVQEILWTGSNWAYSNTGEKAIA